VLLLQQRRMEQAAAATVEAEAAAAGGVPADTAPEAQRPLLTIVRVKRKRTDAPQETLSARPLCLCALVYVLSRNP
jgi:hypothetical protein